MTLLGGPLFLRLVETDVVPGIDQHHAVDPDILDIRSLTSNRKFGIDVIRELRLRLDRGDYPARRRNASCALPGSAVFDNPDGVLGDRPVRIVGGGTFPEPRPSVV
jgi:hypothetical protein